jgi:UDP-N-acetylmuramoylalanine--D-glutamate ligase
LPEVDEIQPGDWVILELSSFQLDELASLNPAPEIAVVTNFSPNHLDRHGTLAEYRTAKQNLIRWQNSQQTAILNQDDSDVSQWTTAARQLGFGRHDKGEQGLFVVDEAATGNPNDLQVVFRDGAREEVLPLGKWLRLPGQHNIENALAASCAALVVGASIPELEVGVRTFSGLPHRLELVAEKSGRRFYNDSKATTPAAASLALAAFDKPIVLLAGGYNKQIDLREFARDIIKHVRGVALLGQTASELDRLLSELDPNASVARHIAEDFSGACEWATQFSCPGDVVLLSPGCASYDWFPNYEVRGELFTKWVQNWAEPPES